MSKKTGSKVSKKNYIGAKRVTIDGVRVWEYQGKSYSSLKELDMTKNPNRYIKMNFSPALKESSVQIPENSNVSLEINDEEVSKEDFQLNQTNKKFIGGPTEITLLLNINENNKEIE